MARHHRDNHGRRAVAARPTLKTRLNANPSRLIGLEHELRREARTRPVTDGEADRSGEQPAADDDE